MASLGTEVQATSTELVSIIEELKDRCLDIQEQITKEVDERDRLMKEIAMMEKRLTSINSSLDTKRGAKMALEKTIQETSDSFSSILKSSQKLLSATRAEVASLPLAQLTV